MITESDRFNSKLHLVTFVNLFVVDALGDRFSDLFTGVVTWARHIKDYWYQVLGALRSSEASGACGPQHAIVLPAVALLGLVLAGSEPAVHRAVNESLDA